MKKTLALLSSLLIVCACVVASAFADVTATPNATAAGFNWAGALATVWGVLSVYVIPPILQGAAGKVLLDWLVKLDTFLDKVTGHSFSLDETSNLVMRFLSWVLGVLLFPVIVKLFHLPIDPLSLAGVVTGAASGFMPLIVHHSSDRSTS